MILFDLAFSHEPLQDGEHLLQTLPALEHLGRWAGIGILALEPGNHVFGEHGGSALAEVVHDPLGHLQVLQIPEGADEAVRRDLPQKNAPGIVAELGQRPGRLTPGGFFLDVGKLLVRRREKCGGLPGNSLKGKAGQSDRNLGPLLLETKPVAVARIGLFQEEIGGVEGEGERSSHGGLVSGNEDKGDCGRGPRATQAA